MADRLTIYMGPPVQQALAGIGAGQPGSGGDRGSRSGRLNTIAERYLAICADQRPDLTSGEWLALCDLLNGTILDEVSLRGIEADIEDAEPDRVEQWGAERDALAAKLRALTLPQRVAVAETVERWWRGYGDHDTRLEMALAPPR